jgi:ribosomal protein S18 acetylase RimI-like enzyme
MDIVELRIPDIKSALALVWSSFVEFEAPGYSEQGITTFKEFIQYDSILEKIERGELFFWGCFINSDLVGVMVVRNMNHICMLFVKKDFHRRGIAKRLFQTLVDRCISKVDSARITVNSSPYAVDVYHRLGFKDTGVEQVADGLTFTPMEYKTQASRLFALGPEDCQNSE